MTERPERSKPRGRRWGCWCCSFVLVLALVPVVAYLILWNTTAVRFAAELNRLKRAGEPLEVSELVPKIGSGEDNAADVYEQAFNIQPEGLSQYAAGATSKWSADEAAAARKLIAENQDYFATLEQASRIPKCVFEKDWDAGPNVMFEEFAPLREAARALQTKAEVARLTGRPDEAVASCGTMTRIAGHCAQSPVLIGQLVASAIDGIGVAELQRVLSSGDPSPAACRVLFQQLGQRRYLEPMVTAMKAERANGLAFFEIAERTGALSGPLSGMTEDYQGGPNNWLLNLYPLLGKPLWNQDKVHFLHISGLNIAAAGKPWAKANQEFAAVDEALARLPQHSSIMTHMLTPSMSRAFWSAYRAAAYGGAARVALAAEAYKGVHGRYPASVDDLARDGWALPFDPFTGAPYRYAQEGRGIAVWSVGPDMTDNLGRDYDPRTRWDQPGYDFAFRCSR